MRGRERVASLLLLVLLVGAVRLGQQVYAWFAYAEERAELQSLSLRLEDAGLEVMSTQIAADSLRAEIQRRDAELGRRKKRVASFERFLLDGALPGHLYESYRTELDGYNLQVQQRNEVFLRWKDVVVRNHSAVNRYNDLADRIRALANHIGEPYFRIPSPVELAVEHGLVRSGDTAAVAERASPK